MNDLYELASPHAAGYRDIDPARVAHAHDKPRLIDVREAEEFTGELGHVPGAELVPLATVDSAAQGWERAREIVMICRSGGRSGRAAALLTSMGFSRVMNMTGGMIAWNAAALPTER